MTDDSRTDRAMQALIASGGFQCGCYAHTLERIDRRAVYRRSRHRRRLRHARRMVTA